MPNLHSLSRFICKRAYLLAGSVAVCFASVSYCAPLPANIEQNLISFSPNVKVRADHLPCTGIRVGKEVLLTSSECAHIIDEELNNGETIEVINSETTSLGKVVSISTRKTIQGFLGIDDWDYEQVDDSHYPQLSGLRTAAIHGYAYYSGEQQEGIVNINLQFLRVDEQKMTYRMDNNLSFPSGTPIVDQEVILCTISSGGICTTHISSPLELLSRQRRSHNYSNSTYKPTAPYEIGESFQDTGGGVATIIIGVLVASAIICGALYICIYCCPVNTQSVSLLSHEDRVRYLEDGERRIRDLQSLNRHMQNMHLHSQRPWNHRNH